MKSPVQYNNYGFCTAKVFTQTLLIVMFTRTFPVVLCSDSYKNCCLLGCDLMQFCRTSNQRNLIILKC
jgi:hypothetical protein